MSYSALRMAGSVFWSKCETALDCEAPLQDQELGSSSLVPVRCFEIVFNVSHFDWNTKSSTHGETHTTYRFGRWRFVHCSPNRPMYVLAGPLLAD